jgi:guanylate kinase
MAGKSSTAKALFNKLQTEGMAIEMIKETTTRPKRESDYYNPEYYFVTDEEYEQRSFYSSVSFMVSSGEKWKYGLEHQTLPDLSILVTNMYAVHQLLNNPGLLKDTELIIFYLKVSKHGILKRDKGDRISQSGDDIINRIKRDINAFEYYYRKLKDKINCILCDNISLDYIVDIIYNNIKERIGNE